MRYLRIAVQKIRAFFVFILNGIKAFWIWLINRCKALGAWIDRKVNEWAQKKIQKWLEDRAWEFLAQYGIERPKTLRQLFWMYVKEALKHAWRDFWSSFTHISWKMVLRKSTTIIGRVYFHWGLPATIGFIGYLYFHHNVLIGLGIGLLAGIILNASTYVKKRYIAFIQFACLLSLTGYNGYLRYIGIGPSNSTVGWSGVGVTVGIFSLIIGVGCVFTFLWRGVKAFLLLISRAIGLSKKDALSVPVKKRYILFALVTCLLCLAGYHGYLHIGFVNTSVQTTSFTSAQSISGWVGVFGAMVLWTLLVGFCCVLYWLYHGVRETLGSLVEDFRFTPRFKNQQVVSSR